MEYKRGNCRRVDTGATATVSTLETVVGHPNTPTSAGNGGFSRGLPCLPSRDSIKACRGKMVTDKYIDPERALKAKGFTQKSFHWAGPH